jgi:hypothetical protein
MPDPASPADRLLDVFVFVPAGLAITVVEELPKLADKGRRRVEHDVTTAKVVGWLAVRTGQRRLVRAWSDLTSRPSARRPIGGVAAPGPESVAPAAPGGPGGPVAGRPDNSSGDGPHVGRETPSGTESMLRRIGSPPMARAVARVGHNGHSDPPNSDRESLAIPRYDSLSASQVVQRLDGLTAPELEAVRAHEVNHRHRRTILHRIEQLLAATGGEHA